MDSPFELDSDLNTSANITQIQGNVLHFSTYVENRNHFHTRREGSRYYFCNTITVQPSLQSNVDILVGSSPLLFVPQHRGWNNDSDWRRRLDYRTGFLYPRGISKSDTNLLSTMTSSFVPLSLVVLIAMLKSDLILRYSNLLINYNTSLKTQKLYQYFV